MTDAGCTFIMFRGAITGRVITCGVCDWCRAYWANIDDMLITDGAS